MNRKKTITDRQQTDGGDDNTRNAKFAFQVKRQKELGTLVIELLKKQYNITSHFVAPTKVLNATQAVV